MRIVYWILGLKPHSEDVIQCLWFLKLLRTYSKCEYHTTARVRNP